MAGYFRQRWKYTDNKVIGEQAGPKPPVVSRAEHGKPVSLPLKGKVDRKGRRWGLQAGEGGKSERHSVMGWIGIERKRHHSTGNRTDFRLVFHHEKTYRTS